MFATRMLTRLCSRTRSLSAGELVWKPYLSGPETAPQRRRARKVVELGEGATLGTRRTCHVLTRSSIPFDWCERDVVCEVTMKPVGGVVVAAPYAHALEQVVH